MRKQFLLFAVPALLAAAVTWNGCSSSSSNAGQRTNVPAGHGGAKETQQHHPQQMPSRARLWLT
jgi:hypothetical protein